MGGVVEAVFSAIFVSLLLAFGWLREQETMRAGNIGCCELNRVMVPSF